MADVTLNRFNSRAALVDSELRAIKAPVGGRIVVRDPACQGLTLRVTGPSNRRPFGAKTWSLECKTQDGRQRRFTLGTYPDLPLARAREAANELRPKAKRGLDPVEERREAQRRARLTRDGTADAGSLKGLLDSFERLKARPSGLRSWKEMRRQIEVGFAPFMDRPPARIARADFRAVLDAAVTRGAPISGKRACRYLGRVMNWAVERELLTVNPAKGLNLDELSRAEQPRQHILGDDEIQALWAATASATPPFGDLAKIYLLTALRRDELADARWTDLEADTLVVLDTKTGQPHRLPAARHGPRHYSAPAAARVVHLHHGYWRHARPEYELASGTRQIACHKRHQRMDMA